MGDAEIIGWLTGPTGGIFALGAMAGIVATWAVNLKIISPYMRQAHAAELAAIRSQMDALVSGFNLELASLQSRVRALEVTETEYHEILKERANLRGERGTNEH